MSRAEPAEPTEPASCVFCDLVAGRIEAPLAEVDEHAVAFPPMRQPGGHQGYMLVVPRVHVRNLYDLPEPLLAPMLAAVRRVALAVHSAFEASGTTIRQNNEPPGQDVFHLHFHVIPRFAGDRLATASPKRLSDDDRAEQVARLRSGLAATAGDQPSPSRQNGL